MPISHTAGVHVPLVKSCMHASPLALSQVSLGAQQDAQRVVPYLLFEHLLFGVVMGLSHDGGFLLTFLRHDGDDP